MSSNDENDEVIKEFLIESYENLDRLDRDLIALEQNPSSAESIASIFRTIHTIKGTCGFLGYARLEGVAHAAESLLSRLRDEELALNAEITTALLTTVDVIRGMLSSIEATKQDGDADHSELVALLLRLQTGGSATAPVAEPPPPAPAPVVAPPAPAKEPVKKAAKVPAKPKSEAPAPAASVAPPAAVEVAAPAPIPHPVSPPVHHDRAAEPAGDTKAAPTVTDGYVRVDVGVLDKLMNLVGELVLARNQILQFVPGVDDANFTATTQRLNLITTELQSGVMKTRMQPIGNVWEKLPRVVRDLSLALGKRIRVEMEGRETELDKTIIEAIKDPLTHLVRNCVDHGLEREADRLAAGKDAEGRLTLRAFHEGGQVNIEISDDGAGLNLERIRAKAVERGLLSADQAARLGDREVCELIFLPGFSTAEKVSNVSGRGVGMDVVKTNVERIGGVVDLTSRPGLGTTFRIKIPLTLAIIPALIVSSGQDRYAIPQISLLELVRLTGAQVRTALDSIHGAPVCRLRGSLLPLVDLRGALGLEGAASAAELASAETVSIVVLQADNQRFGLIVDRINDSEEIVVKPLGKHLKGIPAFAGATIMGDGRVALILDVLGLAQAAHVVGSQERSKARRSQGTEAEAPQRRKQSLLLFSLADGRPIAVPLSMVSRLEIFDARTVEPLADYRVVQYRGEVMPLLDVDTLMGTGGGNWQSEGPLHVVVHGYGKRYVGLVVKRIVDVVEEHLELKKPAQGRTASGVLGCAVIQKRVTELLDLDVMLRTEAGRFLLPSDDGAAGMEQ